MRVLHSKCNLFKDVSLFGEKRKNFETCKVENNGGVNKKKITEVREANKRNEE